MTAMLTTLLPFNNGVIIDTTQVETKQITDTKSRMFHKKVVTAFNIQRRSVDRCKDHVDKVVEALIAKHKPTRLIVLFDKPYPAQNTVGLPNYIMHVCFYFTSPKGDFIVDMMNTDNPKHVRQVA